MLKSYKTILTVSLVLKIFSAYAQPALTGKVVYHTYSDYNAWDSQLFTLDLATGVRTAISAGWNIDHEMNANWSPDGTKLVFMGDVAGEPRDWDIFLWTVGTSQPVNLTNGGGREEDPKFSPNGQRIVFKKDNDIWQMDLNGNIINNVTNTADIEESMPIYTADGNSILFAPGVGAGSDIYRINTDGSGRQLVIGAANVQEYFPSTRDNASFFYTGWQNSSDFHDQIYLKYYANSGSTRLPFNTSTANYSDAYPVGSQYVLLSSDKPGGKGNYDVYIADINTGQIWSLDLYNSNVNSSLQDLGPSYNGNGGGSTTTQTPYGGTAWAIPGKVEAENYDNGGEGVAYHDNTSGNAGGVYRTDGVDIEATTDTGGGYDVGYIATGEWLEYTVNVTTPGSLNGQLRIATASAGGIAHVEMDGVNISGNISIPNTGGWQTWQNVTFTTTSISTGQKVMRIYFDAGGFNLNSVTFSATTSAQTPYGGTAWAVPGKIEAENYDNGGEGIAYHDVTSGNSGGVYRSDGVDIESTIDTGGGYDVGSIATGEWLEYTVNVTTAGSLSAQLRIATATAGGIAHIEMDGVNVSGNISIPNTGGWQTWQTVTVNTTSITTGQKVMRVYIDAGGFNLNFVNFSAASNPQTPYGGTAWTIPGKIEAENYDNGGETVAYHDNTSGNAGGVYRSDAVDIESTTDTGGGYNIGWIETGEWLEYTVNVTSSGIYNVKFRVAASGTGGSLHVEMNGVNVSGTVAIPNTGGWQTWQTVSVNTSSISSGSKVMRVYADAGGFNINYLNFTLGAARLSVETTADEWSAEKLNLESYPNPVSDRGHVSIQIPSAGHTVISLHNIAGEKISVVGDAYLNAGNHKFEFTVEGLRQGMYFLKMIHNGRVVVKKIVKS